jgi:hypothetical protein
MKIELHESAEVFTNWYRSGSASYLNRPNGYYFSSGDDWWFGPFTTKADTKDAYKRFVEESIPQPWKGLNG